MRRRICLRTPQGWKTEREPLVRELVGLPVVTDPALALDSDGGERWDVGASRGSTLWGAEEEGAEGVEGTPSAAGRSAGGGNAPSDVFGLLEGAGAAAARGAGAGQAGQAGQAGRVGGLLLSAAGSEAVFPVRRYSENLSMALDGELPTGGAAGGGEEEEDADRDYHGDGGATDADTPHDGGGGGGGLAAGGRGGPFAALQRGGLPSSGYSPAAQQQQRWQRQ